MAASDPVVYYGNWSASNSTITFDNTSGWYGNQVDTVRVTGANTITYAPYPPVPDPVAEDDLAWLRRRVSEIEDFSRIAA